MDTHKLKVLLRKLKAKITRQYPCCTYETKHGHEFERVSDVKTTGVIKWAVFECKECKMVVQWNNFDRAYIQLNSSQP